MLTIKSILNHLHSISPFYFVLFLFLIDILIRFNVINNYNFVEWLIYLNSVLFLNELIKTLTKLSYNKCKHPNYIFFFCVIILLILLILLTLISYGVYFYFGMMPNKGIIKYVINEPLSTWTLVKNYIENWEIILTIIGISLFFFLFINNAPKIYLDRKNWLVNFGISVFALISILSITQKFDQCGLPASQTITAGLDFILISNEEKKTKTLVKTGNIKIPKLDKTADFNVILIINESVRRSAVQIFNDTLKTTPNLFEFKDRHKNDFYQFNRARTNATLTFLSVPSILNGLSPFADKNLWLATPLLWDYAKSISLETFLISSHCFTWGGWKNYMLQSENLDYYYTECEFNDEKNDQINHPLGIGDDNIFITKTINHIDSLNKMKKQFCGVLHLFGPHAPYWYKAENRKFTRNSRETDYFNSIYEQDLSLNKLWNYLEKNQLIDKTVIAFTSDHGEAFGGRNINGHLTSYFEETIGIPLWLYIPNNLLNENEKKILQKNSNNNVSNIDILPTILDLLNIPVVKEIDEKNYGKSLLHHMDKKREIFITNYNNINYSRFDKSYCLITDSLKYIYKKFNEKLEISLYNFHNDPKEKFNLFNKKMPIVSVNTTLINNL